jgi:hypothetical protein
MRRARNPARTPSGLFRERVLGLSGVTPPPKGAAGVTPGLGVI